MTISCVSGFFSPACRAATAMVAALALSACDETGAFNLESLKPAPTEASAATPATGETTEQDVEAPEVFAAREEGLWDGRPSLGGVWVAHPDADAPERVIIRNTENGQFVVGALFRREREVPGPRLQLSSDAASALDILAGAPTELDVTALRREVIEQPVEPEAVDTEVETQLAADTAASTLSAEEISSAAATDEASGGADPIALATAALGEADAAAEPAADTAREVASSAAAAPVTSSALPESTLPSSSLNRPFLQAATLSSAENADRAVKQLSDAGLTARASELKREDKSLWRVVVGPAASEAERNTMLEKVKAVGFTDAFAVSN
ncbi:SPOR domain-containing protein [Roseobacter sp. S98]|uniref:SPOR domain-containing protein n=1 Tax=Roseobacter algicola (ex Choi et al. 2025) (nom. illeg.) TaxID=3092138 RepID=UPI003F518E77